MSLIQNKDTVAEAFLIFAVNAENKLQRYQKLRLFEERIAVGNDHGLILYDRPAAFVSGRLKEGAISTLLPQWREEATRHISVLRKFRRRILLIERSALDQSRSRDVFKAAFPTKPPPPEFVAPEGVATGVDLAIAALAARADPDVRRLMAELEASTSVGPVVKGDKHYNAVDIIIEDRSLRGEKIRALETELANQSVAKADSSASETILLQQLTQLQNSLVSMDAELRKVQAKNKQLKNEKAEQLASFEKEREQILQSTSWRVTAPLRSARTILKR